MDLSLENDLADRSGISLFGFRSNRDIDSRMADNSVCFGGGRLLIVGAPDPCEDRGDSLYSRTRRKL